MDTETQKKLADLETKVDAILTSVEKTRKYMKWTLIITILVVVLPAVLLAFALPAFVSNYSSQLSGLGL